jgi:hypothetical protein
MSYESLMGFGVEPSGDLVQTVASGSNPVTNPHSGDGTLAALGIGALLTLLLGGVLLGLAAPFALGAIGGAIAAPSGQKKDAAKTGAIYGGLIGVGANIALSLISSVIRAASGSRTAYIGGAGLVPLAVGLYIGYKRRDRS